MEVIRCFKLELITSYVEWKAEKLTCGNKFIEDKMGVQLIY